MKKLAAAFFVLFVFCCLHAVAAPEWVFDNSQTISSFKFNGCTAQLYNGVMHVKPTTWDPTVSVDVNQAVDCSQYPYVAFNMSASTPVKVGGLFFGTDLYPGPNGAEYSQFDLDNSGDWCDYIIDMSSYSHKRWVGRLEVLRLDPQNDSAFTPDADIYIGRIGIFHTRSQAQAFLDEQVFPGDDIYPQPQWIFNGSDSAELWLTGDLQYDNELDVAYYHTTGSDAQLKILLNSIYDGRKKKFDAQSYRYFALRYNATGDNDSRKGALFFSNNNGHTFSDGNLAIFDVNADSAYHNLVLDMGAISGWKGEITALRLDLLNPNGIGESYIISRMGFFADREEAQAFLQVADPQSDSPNFDSLYEYRTDDFRLLVPPGTLDYGYRLADYTMNVDGARPGQVVFFTDARGEKQPVPLSDVNSDGYLRYTATKPGNYTLDFNTKSFEDTKGHWAEEYINYLASRQVLSGTSENEFSPDVPMTRGMFATALGRLIGIDIGEYTGQSYPDVNINEYYAPYALWAKSTGIVQPRDGMFAPEYGVTRAEAAQAVCNFIENYGFEVKTFGLGKEFSDTAGCTKEQIEAIQSVLDNGIMKADNGRFFPNGLITRAEASEIITKLTKAVLGAEYAGRFSRDKFLIGAFGFDKYLYTDQGITDLVNMDVDLLMSGSADPELLRLLEEYGMPFIPGGRLHSWWGDNGQNAGGYSSLHPAEALEAELQKAHKSEVIVGDYIVDEPSAKDFAGINDVFEEYKRLTDGKMVPFVNLYPNYGSTQPENNPNATSQLGTTTYAGYVDQYVKNLQVDYISFDNYPFQSAGAFSKYLQNLDEAGAAARDHNLDMWIIIQTGAWTYGELINRQQIEWQMYLCMAYGANGIMHACYTKNWWDENTSCVNLSGVPNQTYYMTQAANREIHAFSDIFMQYDYLGTYAVGYESNTSADISGQLSAQNARNMQRDGFDGLDGIYVGADGGCAVGCFEGKNGQALMIVNCKDPHHQGTDVEATVNIGFAQGATAYIDGRPVTLDIDEYGDAHFTVKMGEGVFVTIEQ